MTSRIDEFKGNREKQADIIVSIDGPSGAGKGTLAGMIEEELEIDHFSASDVFYDIADERNLSAVELSRKAGKDVDIQIDRRTLEKALRKSCVVDGRITSWVLGGYADLKIYLTAEHEERARRVGQREDETREEARKRIRDRDNEDSRRYNDYYGVDTEDTSFYDVVIDNTNMSLEEEREKVRKILEEQDLR